MALVTLCIVKPAQGDKGGTVLAIHFRCSKAGSKAKHFKYEEMIMLSMMYGFSTNLAREKIDE